MIESGVLPMDDICTHQLPLADFQKGLDLVASGTESVKVSLIPALNATAAMSAQRPRHRAADVAAKHAGGHWALRVRAAVSLPCSVPAASAARPAPPNGAGESTGGFDWRKASGSTINILQTPHPYQLSYQPLLKEFTELTGITVNVDLVPEADYFTKLNTELAGGSGKHDAFMLGAYFIWQYGPPGLDRGPRPVAEELLGHQRRVRLRGHLRRSAHLHPLGLHAGQSAGHRRAVGDPVGFREQRGRLQQADLRREGHQEAARQARRLHPAGRRPDRPLAEPLRHLDPRVEVMGHHPSRLHDPVHPRGRGGLHVQRLRTDRGDGQRQGDRVHREVDRDAAQGRADVVDHLRLSQRHRRSR